MSWVERFRSGVLSLLEMDAADQVGERRTMHDGRGTTSLSATLDLAFPPATAVSGWRAAAVCAAELASYMDCMFLKSSSRYHRGTGR